MSWNYRVIRVPDETAKSGYFYTVHEVYCSESDEPHSWTENPETAFGDKSGACVGFSGPMPTALGKLIPEISNDEPSAAETGSKMTRDEYFALDIEDRLAMAGNVLLDEEGSHGPHDQLVFQDGGIGIFVTDVIYDAILTIRRLRKG
jgi:hypothetical protein